MREGTNTHNRPLKMKVIIIPCLIDRYSYLVIDEQTKHAAVVDPFDREEVLKAAEDNGVELRFVLLTNHSSVVDELVPGITVYGGFLEEVEGRTYLQKGAELPLGADIKIVSLDTPWQIEGQLSYYFTGKEEDDRAVFTGETLSVAGCGGFGFEWREAERVYKSLYITLASLPKPTRVYCCHERTVENLRFAKTILQKNAMISQKLKWAKMQRQSGLPTIPSTIGEELEINPFLQVHLPEIEIQRLFSGKSPVARLCWMKVLQNEGLVDLPPPFTTLKLEGLSVKTVKACHGAFYEVIKQFCCITWRRHRFQALELDGITRLADEMVDGMVGLQVKMRMMIENLHNQRWQFTGDNIMKYMGMRAIMLEEFLRPQNALRSDMLGYLETLRRELNEIRDLSPAELLREHEVRFGDVDRCVYEVQVAIREYRESFELMINRFHAMQ